MTQLQDAAVGDAIEIDDAPAAPRTGDDLADMLGLDEDPKDDDDIGTDDDTADDDDQTDDDDGKAVDPPIDPPASWKADAKELFAQLPPEMQKVVSEREAQREAFVQSKAQDAANTRMAVENEARAVIAQQSQRMAQELQQYASMVTPQRPDPAMLQYDPQGFYQAQSQYEAAIAQRTEAQQQAAIYEDQARQQAAAIEQAEMQAEVATLRSQFPEWFAPETSANLQKDLTAIALELGYTETHVSQARAADILAMKKAAEWKAKATKWDAANKAKMEGVRAAKTLPKVAKPGVARTADQGRASKAEAAFQRTLTAKSRAEKSDAFGEFLTNAGLLD